MTQSSALSAIGKRGVRTRWFRAAGATIAILATSLTALASGPVTGTATNVAVSGNATFVSFTVVVNSIGYVASSGTGSCPSVLADVIKGYQSIAEASVLSGKTVTLTYTACGGLNYLNSLELNQ